MASLIPAPGRQIWGHSVCCSGTLSQNKRQTRIKSHPVENASDQAQPSKLRDKARPSSDPSATNSWEPPHRQVPVGLALGLVGPWDVVILQGLLRVASHGSIEMPRTPLPIPAHSEPSPQTCLHTLSTPSQFRVKRSFHFFFFIFYFWLKKKSWIAGNSTGNRRFCGILFSCLNCLLCSYTSWIVVPIPLMFISFILVLQVWRALQSYESYPSLLLSSPLSDGIG